MFRGEHSPTGAIEAVNESQTTLPHLSPAEQQVYERIQAVNTPLAASTLLGELQQENPAYTANKMRAAISSLRSRLRDANIDNTIINIAPRGKEAMYVPKSYIDTSVDIHKKTLADFLNEFPQGRRAIIAAVREAKTGLSIHELLVMLQQYRARPLTSQDVYKEIYKINTELGKRNYELKNKYKGSHNKDPEYIFAKKRSKKKKENNNGEIPTIDNLDLSPRKKALIAALLEKPLEQKEIIEILQKYVKKQVDKGKIADEVHKLSRTLRMHGLEVRTHRSEDRKNANDRYYLSFTEGFEPIPFTTHRMIEIQPRKADSSLREVSRETRDMRLRHQHELQEIADLINKEITENILFQAKRKRKPQGQRKIVDRRSAAIGVLATKRVKRENTIYVSIYFENQFVTTHVDVYSFYKNFQDMY